MKRKKKFQAYVIEYIYKGISIVSSTYWNECSLYIENKNYPSLLAYLIISLQIPKHSGQRKNKRRHMAILDAHC